MESPKLNQAEIFSSRFDLNIEKNRMKQPIKPVIRLGMPIFNHAGRKRRLIMLNYSERRLLGLVAELRAACGRGLCFRFR